MAAGPQVEAITEYNAEIQDTTNVTKEPDYIRLILTSRVYDVCKETPLVRATSLSERCGAEILFKREDLQPVFSFKLRGAYNMIAHLTDEQRWRGVVAVSAGNHAQGVAYSARHLNIPATIVMPLATPSIKYNNVERMGGKVVLSGANFDEAKIVGAELAEKHNLANIPPYDDPLVIAGQGTIAMEVLRQTDVSKLKTIFVCVGGGGLIAGIAAYAKRLAPHVKIIGVETHDADAMKASLDSGERIMLKDVGLFADGTAVRIVGEQTFRLCKKYVDEIVLVTTDELCAAIKDVFEDTRSIVEPSGALGVAGVKKWLKQHPEHNMPGDKHAVILSGANMNFDRLRFVAERADLGLGNEVFFTVMIPERPGSFLRLYENIAPRAVTEFSYRQSHESEAFIYLSFKVQSRSEVPELLASLAAEGFSADDVSDNEMAKSHARYMVGGKSRVPDERVFRFEFPERPGALSKFLHGLQSDWNISLFHYRNHGADVSSILAGIQVPKDASEQFDAFLKGLGYPFVDETQNPVYKKFMAA